MLFYLVVLSIWNSASFPFVGALENQHPMKIHEQSLHLNKTDACLDVVNNIGENVIFSFILFSLKLFVLLIKESLDMFVFHVVSFKGLFPKKYLLLVFIPRVTDILLIGNN